MRCQNFLKNHKNSGEKIFAKYLPADSCFVKTNATNSDDNDDAICFLILVVCFFQAAHETKFHWKYQSDPFAQQLGLSMSTKSFDLQKIEDGPAYCPDRYELLQISRQCKNSLCFQKVVQFFNPIQDYFPIRDSKRLECVKKCF